MDREEPEPWRSAGGGSFGASAVPAAAPGEHEAVELKSGGEGRMFAVNQSLLWQYAAAAAAAALRPPVAICRAQSPAARAIKKRKKRHEGAFWAGVESTSPSAGAAVRVNSLDGIVVVDRRGRVEEDLGRGERLFAADQGSPPWSAARASKKRKNHQEREFLAGIESTSPSPLAEASSLRSHGSIRRAQSPAARAGKKRKNHQEREFWAGIESTSPSPLAEASSLRPHGSIRRAQSPAARAGKKRKNHQEREFWAGIESTSPSPLAEASSLRPHGSIRRAQSPAARAGKKRKNHQEREFWAGMGVNSLDEVAVVDRRARGEEDLGGRGRLLGATRASKKREDGVFWAGMESTSWSAAAPAPGVDSLDEIAVVDGKLRDVLRSLGASTPVRIYGKRLSKSDRVMNQHRLLMTCRSWRHGEQFPLDEVLTAEEKPSVQVQAYDRAGRPYVLDCKKLECNKAYRLIAGWRRFLTENGLAVPDDARAEDLEPAMVELWAFRSPALTVGVAGQPRGALGLVIVHYRQGDAPHADAAIAEVLAAARNRVAMPLPVAVPVLEHAVRAPHHEDAVHAMEEADDGAACPEAWPDARTLEAAEALLMLSES